MKLQWFKYIILLAVIFLLNSCNHNETGFRVVRFWGLGVEGEAVAQLIREFETENPGIIVKVQMIPWTAAQEKLISAYASENLPDVFQLGNTWIPQFQELDAIATLDTFINTSGNIDSSKFFKGIWDTNIINGKVYGIPWYIDTRVLFYRTDDLYNAGYSKPPVDWSELLDVSLKIKKNKLKKDLYPIFLPFNDWSVIVIFALQAGAKLLVKNNSYANFSSGEFKKAVEFLMQFYDKNLAPKGSMEFNNIYQAMAEGYISMFISGPWNIKEMKKWMKDELENEWMTAPLPSPDSNGIGISLAGGASLVMNKMSNDKAAAWKLIDFLSRPATQMKFYQIVDDLPARREVWNYPEIKKDKYMKAFFTQLNHVQPLPKVTEWEQIAYSKIQQYMEYIVYKKMSIDEALKKLDDDVNSILEKRRWMIKNNLL